MPYHRSIRCITIALTAMFALTAACWSNGQQPPETSASGVLVLRNGNVLYGTVQRSGGHFRVTNEGSVLQVPAAQVEMACNSLVQAYEQRREQRVGRATDAHLELARWCLRHGLLAQAAREILDARTDDPGHPALRTLDLQLQQGLADEASRQQRERDAVALAAHAEPAPPAAVAVEPDHLIEPTPEVQQQFVRSIQPMLIHGCTTAGCHTADSSQAMRLDRWALEGSGIPALIRKNLEHVLAQVDVEDPASSPLMRRARQAHGMRNKQLSTPLAPYQTAILMEWLNEAAGADLERKIPVEATGDAARPSAYEGTPRGDGDVTEEMVDELEREMRSTRKNRTAFTPRDQFDPEIFNRRRQRKAAPSKGSSSAEDDAFGGEYVPETIELGATEPASAAESADPLAAATNTD